jgi:hypothetical protein
MPRHRNEAGQKPSEELKLPKEEQWRLINESGVLGKLSGAGPHDGNLANVEESIPLADEIFNATLLVIPFSFLLLMFEMYVLSSIWNAIKLRYCMVIRLIQHQYARQPSLRDLADRMVPSVPSEYACWDVKSNMLSILCLQSCQSSYFTVRISQHPLLVLYGLPLFSFPLQAT